MQGHPLARRKTGIKELSRMHKEFVKANSEDGRFDDSGRFAIQDTVLVLNWSEKVGFCGFAANDLGAR